MKKKQLSGSIEPAMNSSPERAEDKRAFRPKANKELSPDSRIFDSKMPSPPKRKMDTSAKPEEEQKGPPEIYLHRNPQGGIYVHEKDIETLFRFIDSNNYGRITMQDLKKKVSLFAKEMTNRDFKFLMAGKNDISIKELYDILKYNELEDFDPIAEAFKFYDPEGTGFVDMNRLKEIFSLLGYEELTSGDLQILVECADADLDGKISLEDFRKLIPVYEPKEGDPKMKNINVVSDPELHNQFVANLKEYGDTKKY
ncbi:hypothetical protein SteCoe_5893 [Stentor coeruleus]|uniref:Calmodulin n=1 Tax=Stentor coeruleus TaxID=5963 RepID=A0A1R2CRA9_9CILI|nr:hypothetical protein SteCoe_5893 [Stentor coeruleus]